MNKLRVLPVSQACQCPFYVKDTADANHCFIKHSMPVHLAMAVMEEVVDFNPDSWSQDCGGTYAHCSVLPLLWNFHAPDSEGKTAEAQLVDQGIDDFDPFTDSDNDTSEAEAPKEAESHPVAAQAEPEPPVAPKVSVTIHQLDNPYQVKSDVLVCPANIVLTVDDPLLNRMSRGTIQQECDKLARPIKMGHVYITSNGGDKSEVKPKSVIHAVVSGPSRLVNEQDIKSAVRKSLHLADEMGAQKVVMLPCDCGTHDVGDAARVQLSAIHTFLNSVETKSITHIFIVMDDEESIEIFQDYFDRIFE